MGSKGTSTQQQQSTYTPSPQVTAAGTQALGQAQTAAATPFNLPQAPVAGFNPQQQQAFQQYGQLQNLYQPYYNQAQSYFNQSAQAPTGADVSQYLNPYAGYVLGNLREQQGQQMNQLTGQATQTAGGVGADRIGVAQGELARQQGLATGQTLAGLYGSALGAAQQQKQQEQAAGYGLGNLGGANLQSALGATSALYGSGAYQQQLNQAQLNAQYQNTLQQQAYPFQTAQYLGNVTSGLAGALGGTTGAYGQATPAQPSPYGQALGLAGLGLGAYGLAGGFGGGTGSYLYPGSAIPGAQGPTSVGGAQLSQASGGRINPFDTRDAFDDGGGVGGGVTNNLDSSQNMNVNNNLGSGLDTGYDIGSKYRDWLGSDSDVPSGKITQAAPHIPQLMQQGTGSSGGGKGSGLNDIASIAKIAAMFAAKSGGRVGYDDGGGVGDNPNFLDRWQDRVVAPFFNAGAAQGTKAPDSIPGGEPANVPLPQPRPPGADTINPDAPYRLAGPAAMQDWRNNRNIELSTPDATDTNLPRGGDKTPIGTVADDDKGALQTAQETGAKNRQEMQNRQYDVPYPGATQDQSSGFARSPWLALAAAGAGTLANGSPWPGVALGKGLQTGISTLEDQRKQAREEEGVNQRARQLAQQAEFHMDEFTRIKPEGAARTNIAEKQLEQQKWQLIYDPTTGQPSWTKPGEQSIPALGGAAQGAGPSPAVGGQPPTAPQAGAVPKVDKTKFDYISADNARHPGPVFNPKTGVPDATNTAISRKEMEEASKKSDASAGVDLQVTQLEQALGNIDEANKNGIWGTGAGANTRMNIARTINTIGAPLGLQPVDPKIIANAEEASKITTRLGFELAKTLGSREAQMIVQQAIASIPGLENTPEGRKYLIASIRAGAKMDKEQADFTNDYFRKYRTTAGAAQEFHRLNPAGRYVAEAAVSSAPAEFKDPEKFKKAVERLRVDRSPDVIAHFNKIYHGSANYFLQD